MDTNQTKKVLEQAKFLIIDDDSSITDTIKDIVQTQFHEPQIAHSINEAQEYLNQQKFDCLILDLNLNNENGGLIVKELKESSQSLNHKTPVIILSGYVDDQFIEKFKAKFFAILPKPFDSRYLLTQLKQAVITANPSLLFDEKKVLPNLKKTVEKIKSQMKVPYRLKEKTRTILAKKHPYIKTHNLLSIAVSIALLRKLGWDSEQTLEKIIYTHLLKDHGLEGRENIIRLAHKGMLKTHPDFETLKNYPLETAKTCLNTPNIPEDVSTLIEQHKELPDGSGFPQGLSHKQILPLTIIIILSSEVANYLISHPKGNIQQYVKKAKDKYNVLAFKNILTDISILFS